MTSNRSAIRWVAGLLVLLGLGALGSPGEAAGRARLRVLDLNLRTRVGTATVQYLRVLSGMDPGVQRALNHLFRAQAQERLGEAKGSFAEDPDLLRDMKANDWPPGSMERVAEVTWNRKGFLSFTLEDSEFVPRMAHPSPGFSAQTYDLNTAEPVPLSRILRGTNWRKVVDQEVRRQFQASGKTLLPDTRFPDLKDYEKNVYLTEKPRRGLVFFWNFYDFTPYAAGLCTFFVPFDLLGDAVEPSLR